MAPQPVEKHLFKQILFQKKTKLPDEKFSAKQVFAGVNTSTGVAETISLVLLNLLRDFKVTSDLLSFKTENCEGLDCSMHEDKSTVRVQKWNITFEFYLKE